MRSHPDPSMPFLRILLTALFLLLAGLAAQAQESPLTDAQIAALLAQSLPAGVGLAQADDAQLAQSIAQALAARPDGAAAIVAYLCRSLPDQILLIVDRAVNALPSARDAIVAAAKGAAPPALHGAIEKSADEAYRKAVESQGGTDAPGSGSTGWAPTTSRDDAPASPVKP